jgi:hypothetical protein
MYSKAKRMVLDRFGKITLSRLADPRYNIHIKSLVSWFVYRVIKEMDSDHALLQSYGAYQTHA